MTIYLIPQLLVGPLLGAFWSLQRIHPAAVSRHWFWAWATLYAAAAITSLGVYDPVFTALGLLPGSLHPFLLLSASLYASGRRLPRGWLVVAALVGVLRGACHTLGFESPVFAVWIPVGVGLELFAAVLLLGERDGILAGRGRALPHLTAGYALVHGGWLVAAALGRPEAVWLAPVWVLAAAGLASTQMLAMTELVRRYEAHLQRERRVTERALEKRYEFERGIVALSTRFVRLEPSQLDAAIHEALAEIGQFAAADRCAISLFASEGDPGTAQGWCAPDAHGSSSAWRSLSVSELPWIREQIASGAVVRATRVRDLPDVAVSEREMLERTGIGSLLSVPLTLGSEVIGAVSLFALRSERVWSDDGVARLRLCADLFAHALGRQRSMLALEERQAELRQAQKMEAVGSLAGGIAHDFNNLLTVISGYGEHLRGNLDKGDDLHESAKEIVDAAGRAAELTRRLLAFSRRQVLEPCPFDLNETVEGLEGMLRRLIGEHIFLVTKLCPDLPQVNADPSQIEQVIVNLVVNARDAMPQGGRIEIATGLLASDAPQRPSRLGPGRTLLLRVADDGCGIEPDLQARVFEPFFTTKPPGVGTGMGLSVVHGIVEQSGGLIELRSEPGSGTCIDVYLPASNGSRREPPPPPQDSQPAASDASRSTVLLVEDEERVRRLSRRALERAGYIVIDAGDGERALEVAASHAGPIDLLFTDVVMPRVGGPELAARLKKLRPEMRVLFTSGYPTHPTHSLESLPSQEPFLPKPFTIERLRNAVRDALEGKTD